MLVCMITTNDLGMSVNAGNNYFLNYIFHYILKSCLVKWMLFLIFSLPLPPKSRCRINFSLAKELHFLSSVISVTLMSLFSCHITIVRQDISNGFQILFYSLLFQI